MVAYRTGVGDYLYFRFVKHSFVLRLPASPTKTGLCFILWHKKSVRLDSSNPSNCRYRQTPSTERIEETISHACFHIKWVFGTSLITKTKGEHRSSSSVFFLAISQFRTQNAFLAESGFLPQLICKNSHFSDQCSVRWYFFFVLFICHSVCISLRPKHKKRACPNFSHSAGRLW